MWDSLPAAFGFVETYLRKGDRVYVEGEIDYRSYEDNGGNTQWATEIKTAEVIAVGATRNAGNRGEGGPTTRTRRRGKAARVDELQVSAL